MPNVGGPAALANQVLAALFQRHVHRPAAWLDRCAIVILWLEL
ncbi:MAG: hypothetical protein RLZZ415_1072, partial [Pseudomonadota bacterium]